MKSVAIIGLGWFGLPLAKSLLNKGYSIVGTTTDAEKQKELNDEKLNVYCLDLNQQLDIRFFREVFQSCSVCVINVPPSKIQFHAFENRCLSLLELFSSTTRFVFVSSTSVYNDHRSGERLEDSKVLSDFNFRSQLYQTERALQSKLGNRLTVLRFAGLFGPKRNLTQFFAGKSNLAGAKNPVNLLHLDDAIQSVECVLQNECWGEIYNVCAEEHPSRELFYTTLCRKVGLAEPSFDSNETETSSKLISNKKSVEHLGMIYKHSSPMDFPLN